MRSSELEFFVDMLESRKTQIRKNIMGVEKELKELNSLELMMKQIMLLSVTITYVK